MTFSFGSIILAILALCTAIKLVNSQDYYSIKFDVKGSTISSNFRNYRNHVTKMRYEICGILGLHENLVEITKPMQIPNGLQINLNLYINNTKAIDLNPEKIMNNANNSGQLAKIIKNAWELSEMPLISNIFYKKNESKARRKNEVIIKVQAAPASKNAETEGATQQNFNSVEIIPLPPLPMTMPVVATDFGND